MNENSVRLERMLSAKGTLDTQVILAAKEHALHDGSDLADSLVRMGVVDFRGIGILLSELHGVPYRSLLDNPPSMEAKKRIALKVAEEWKIFPAGFDEKRNILVVAVDDPRRRGISELLGTWVLSSCRIEFSVACRDEIERAIDIYYRGASWVPQATVDLPDDFTILSEETEGSGFSLEPDSENGGDRVLILDSNPARGRAVRALLVSEGYGSVLLAASPGELAGGIARSPVAHFLVSARAFPENGAWLSTLPSDVKLPAPRFYYNLAPILMGQEWLYHDMKQIILKCLATAADDAGGRGSPAFRMTIARVRYSQLIAAKLNLPPIRVDRTGIAAWLLHPGLGDSWHCVAEIPYKVLSLIAAVHSNSQSGEVESLIIGVVERFLKSQKTHSRIARDAEGIRAAIGADLAGHPQFQSVVESLIMVLHNEKMLKDLDPIGLKILVIDSTVAEESAVVLRLQNEGYEVLTAVDPDAAVHWINSGSIDAIVSETTIGSMLGIELCEGVRRNTVTARIPFLFFSSQSDSPIMAQCLQSGADDFIEKSAGPNVLTLKLNRLLSRHSKSSPRVIKGNLSELCFSDLVQILSSGGKNVLISLHYGRLSGEIYMKSGMVAHAVTEKIEGEEAFYAIMRWPEGEFEISTCSYFPAITISIPVMALLMEGSRIEDEKNTRQNPGAPGRISR